MALLDKVTLDDPCEEEEEEEDCVSVCICAIFRDYGLAFICHGLAFICYFYGIMVWRLYVIFMGLWFGVYICAIFRDYGLAFICSSLPLSRSLARIEDCSGLLVPDPRTGFAEGSNGGRLGREGQ